MKRYFDDSRYVQEYAVIITLNLEDDGSFNYEESWSCYGASSGGWASGVWQQSGDTITFRCDSASGSFVFQWTQGSTTTATEREDILDFGGYFTMTRVSG